MKYINAQNCKALAKECNGGDPVGRDFLEQIDRLVECIVEFNCYKQEDPKRKTLTATEWAARQISAFKHINKED